MFTKEYKLIKDLIVYCGDDLLLQNKLLFRMLDIKDKYLNENKTLTKEKTELINNEYRKLEILQKELNESEKKDHDNIYKRYAFIP